MLIGFHDIALQLFSWWLC